MGTPAGPPKGQLSAFSGPQTGDGVLHAHGRVLLVIASALEMRSVVAGLGGPSDVVFEQWAPVSLSSRFDVVLSGIGKVNAAGATVKALLQTTPRPNLVLSVGLAGALPEAPVAIGDTVVASSSVYADEGIQTPDAFQSCAEFGFPLTAHDFSGPSVPVDQRIVQALRQGPWKVGGIATVSTCSGTDALAGAVRARTGAVAEAMEGAAVVHAARLLRVPAGEVRVISNTTGDRPKQSWNVRLALDRLTEVIGQL